MTFTTRKTVEKSRHSQSIEDEIPSAKATNKL